MYSIQNRQKRTWIIPAIFKADGAALFEHVNIAPGTSALVNSEHWDSVAKGNLVIEALLTERSLVVDRAERAKGNLHSDELSNPASPKAPEELTDKDDRVKIESKVEVKEVVVDDAPAEVKRK